MARDLAVDLGTATTLVYREGDGIVFDEPAVVALHAGTGEVVTMGEEVWDRLGGHDGSVVAVRPLSTGTMTEFEITQRLLEMVLQRVGASRFPRPRVLVCVPSMAAEVERRAIEEAIHFAGGGRVTLVEEPLAAAIGAGLPVHEPTGNLIVDVGGGRSEMAVVSMGGVVASRGVSVGGFDVDAAIQEHVRAEYDVAIGERAAEELKIAIGSAFPSPAGKAAILTGRGLAGGDTVEIKVTEDEIRQAVAAPIRTIVETARQTLADAPPELTHDVLETGIFLTGGGSLLRGLDMLLAQECEVPVHVTEQPRQTVVMGAGRMLEHLAEYRSAFQLVRRNAAR
jgi:rod shape-determining protein MreB and related proteins